MNLSANAYRDAVADYDRTWRVTDDTLYDLCRRHPSHRAKAGVNAKLWIIGRTYATGIERKIPTNGKQGGSMSQLAEHLLKHAGKLDTLFARLRKVREPLTPARLRTIIDLHGRLIALLQPVMRRNQSPRSFASKYMHFHCPAVPIIDTYVAGILPSLIRWQKSFELFDLPAGADEYYARYVLRFWQLYQQTTAAGLRPKVKHLDYYLLCVAEGTA